MLVVVASIWNHAAQNGVIWNNVLDKLINTSYQKNGVNLLGRIMTK